MAGVRRLPPAALLLTAALVSGCASSEAAPAPTPSAPPPATTAAAAPTVPPPPPPPSKAVAPATDWFTGTAPRSTAPVVALKVDNAVSARPFHRGLGEARLVYQEVVEGGATRFLAVYPGNAGLEVGPIRSGRENDIELLAQFGKVPLGYSGANKAVAGMFAQAERDGRLLDVSRDVVRAPFRTAGRRKDAFNYYTTPAAVVAARPGGIAPRDIGLRFGPLTGGTPASSARIGFSRRSRVDVRYDAPSGRWAVFQDGTQMGGVAPANVVVQGVKVVGSDFRDVVGEVTPFTVTVGSGPVSVLRDGKRIQGRWRRLAPHTGTRVLDAAGKDIALKPGPTWFLLVPLGQPVTFG